MDVIGAFLEENTERGERKKVSCSILYENYKNWCTDAGYYAISKNKFGRRLYESGVQKGSMPNGSKAYVGIALKQKNFKRYGTYNSSQGIGLWTWKNA